MTDYIIIGLLAVNLICLLIFLSKNNNKNNNEMIEKLGKFETDITKSIGDFKFLKESGKSLHKDGQYNDISDFHLQMLSKITLKSIIK